MSDQGPRSTPPGSPDAENTWPGKSEGFEADLAEIEAGLNLIYNAANDEMLGSLRSECVAALQRLRLRLRAEATS